MLSILSHAEISGLYRYPVKGLSAESLKTVPLAVGKTLPADRRYAVENGPSGFDPAQPAWRPKTHYLMLMRHERLAEFQTLYEDDTHRLTIRRDGEMVAQGDLETVEGRAAIEAFFAAQFARELKGPPKVLSGGGYSFSDLARKVVSIINLASVAAIETMVGAAVNPIRFRGNLYVRGWPAWHEASLLHQTLAVGEARLKVVKTITRCAATNVDPETAARDLDIPAALMRRLGHNECGIYAEVVAPGTISLGDTIAVEQAALL
ncbi:MAG TPA: MOSC domain-containing protein [Bradyrhizobium sp.]|nr:MOSC domain-containing protein [Bradyrhizobium sp.]